MPERKSTCARTITAMEVRTRRCRKEPFMQYKSDASTVGDPVFSVGGVIAQYGKQPKREDAKRSTGSRRPE
mgnify:CR=1 FL=1